MKQPTKIYWVTLDGQVKVVTNGLTHHLTNMMLVNQDELLRAQAEAQAFIDGVVARLEALCGLFGVDTKGANEIDTALTA